MSSSRTISINASTAIAIAACTYIVWTNTPDWCKPNFLRKKKGSQEDDERVANEELANPLVVVSKMREMMSIVSNECDYATPDDLPWYKIYASFLALLHLNTEIRINHPDHRDRNYTESGEPVPEQELRYLAEHLDYAYWAYDKTSTPLRTLLARKNFTLIRQDLVTEPGRVGHFIAADFDRKEALIGLKGTSTISDALTDVLGKAHEHKLDGPFVSGYETDTIRCHEGIYTAAKLMADDIQELVEKLLLPSGFKIVICGHSLGAGTACLLGVLLRSRIPALRQTNNNSLSVLAYATPPVLNHDAAVACAPFITSIINDYDIVPRMSLSNLVITNKLIVQVDKELEKDGLSPDSFRQFKRLTGELLTFDEKTLMTCEEVDEFFMRAHREEPPEGENNLFVPGRVVMLYEKGVKEDSSSVEKEFGCVATDGGCKMLRMVETSAQMITDHFCTQYSSGFSTILNQLDAAAQ